MSEGQLKSYLGQRAAEAEDLAKEPGATEWQRGWADALSSMFRDVSDGTFFEYVK